MGSGSLGPPMDSLAPSVVAVVASREPGPWFEQTLASLAAQDYEQLSILVLAGGQEDAVRASVAAHAPGAYVRMVEDYRGYGPTSNLAIEMVDGATFFLLCHDDCSIAPDAVRIMVEESFRSNAGIVTPKLVTMADPGVLLHVGQVADVTGAVAERVGRGEVDHGQHDAVREVFVAPGGCNLVRADLFSALGGFDPGISAMGEDLELSWHAQVAGARVVVAPKAVVAHEHLRSSGQEEVEEGQSLQGLQRRHEVRTMLTCSSMVTLAWAVPMALVLAGLEWLVAKIGRDDARAKVVVSSWRHNLARTPDLKVRRASIAAGRQLSDRELHRRQARGSIRLKTFVTRLFYQGMAVARGSATEDAAVGLDDLDLTGSIGSAFSENQDFDELDDLGHRIGVHGTSRRFLGSRSGRMVAVGLLMVLYLVGSRNLAFSPLPYVGLFSKFPSFTGAWSQMFSSWRPVGVGTSLPAPSGYGTLGALGVLTAGHMALLEDLLVVGMVPLGMLGVARLVSPLVSPRARLATAAAYGAIGLWGSAIQLGRLDGLIAYGALPWLVVCTGRVAGAAPMAMPVTDARLGDKGWSRSARGRLVWAAVLSAMAISLSPALAVALLVVALGYAIGGLPQGAADGLRYSWTTVKVLVGAVVLLGPWVAGMVLHPTAAAGVLGLPISTSSAPSLAALLRFSVGTAGASPVSWALPMAAVSPLVLVRGARLVMASRLAMIAVSSWGLAYLVANHLLGSFAPQLTVILVPGAVAVAGLAGLAISGFEVELADFAFGWRQGVAVFGVAASLLGMVPFVLATGSGSWGLSTSGITGEVEAVTAATATEGMRVLWLADPRVLPMQGWSIEPGLAFGTTTSTTESSTSLFAEVGPGDASHLADAVREAMDGNTTTLGRLLGQGAIGYVVVDTSATPSITDLSHSSTFAVPPSLERALSLQQDLSQVSTAGGITVYRVTDAIPLLALRQEPAPLGVPSSAAAVAGWLPIGTPAPDSLGTLSVAPRGTVLVTSSPSSALRLSVGGRQVRSTPGFSSAAQFASAGGTAALTSSMLPRNGLLAGIDVLAWVACGAALLGVVRPRRSAVTPHEEPS